MWLSFKVTLGAISILTCWKGKWGEKSTYGWFLGGRTEYHFCSHRSGWNSHGHTHFQVGWEGGLATHLGRGRTWFQSVGDRLCLSASSLPSSPCPATVVFFLPNGTHHASFLLRDCIFCSEYSSLCRQGCLLLTIRSQIKHRPQLCQNSTCVSLFNTPLNLHNQSPWTGASGGLCLVTTPPWNKIGT